MSPEEAQQWLEKHVPRETMARLQHYVSLVQQENQVQNLIARSTSDEIWVRHIIDSAQLMLAAPQQAGEWIDIGSGAGLPGLVLAIVGARPMLLIEPRKLRASFLARSAAQLGIADHVSVIAAKSEKVAHSAPAGVVTARAVAPLTNLFASAIHLSEPSTTWLLMKGQSAASELEAARQSWHGDFLLKPSITDPKAAIVIARNVRPRSRR